MQFGVTCHVLTESTWPWHRQIAVDHYKLLLMFKAKRCEVGYYGWLEIN
jgi:hypothetical protein